MKKLLIAILIFLTILNSSCLVLAQENDDIISYEQLRNYKELFDPYQKGVDWGKVPVKIEAVIGDVTDGDENSYTIYSFDMWIKGEKCYYYTQQSVDKYLQDLTAFPERPKYGQRIIYEVTPYSDGGFHGSQVVSYKVIEENVDVKSIEVEYALKCSIPYEEYAELEYDFGKNNPVLIETVIGCVNHTGAFDFSCDIWIKGNDGYHYTHQNSSYKSPLFPSWFEPHYGQRMVLRLHSSGIASYIFSGDITRFFEIEEDVDVKAIEKEYLSTLQDDVRSKIVEPFDEEKFEAIPYKKILRSIEDYAGKPIVIELTYQQDLNNGYGLYSDSDRNYYRLYICDLSIKDEVIDFNLLLKDNIKIYGYIDNKLYTYNSWTGEKTVPSIVVRKAILLDED